MSSNDNVVLGVPVIYCPSCNGVLGVDMQLRFNSLPEERVAQMKKDGIGEPGKSYVLVSCEDEHCDQHHRIKILQVPKLKVEVGGDECCEFDSEVFCRASVEGCPMSCYCELPPNHDGPHICVMCGRKSPRGM